MHNRFKSKIRARRLLLALIFVLVLAWCAAPGGGSGPVAAAASAQQASLAGTLTLLWGDGPPGTKSGLDPIPILFDNNGQAIRLVLGESLTKPLGGLLALDRQRVIVAGEWVRAPTLGGPALLNATSIRRSEARAPSAPRVSGSQPWITIMCKFNDVASEPRNLAYFQGMLGNSKPGLDHYWREQSYDIINILGSGATGWYTLPQPRSYYIPPGDSADLGKLANDCTAVADPYVYFPNYVGINMMFNDNLDGYAWGGSSWLDKDGMNRSWYMTWEPPWGYANIAVIAHEMGHGFGLPHSSGNYGLTYDNQWDVMSDTWSNCSNSSDPTYGCLGQHTISHHKDRLGWISSGAKFSDAAGGTIMLEQLALPQTGNYRMAQISIGGSATHFYTLEVRRKVGYDVKLPGQAVVIHEVDTARVRPAYVVDADGNGNTGDAGAQWLVGETLTDATNGISVSVDSALASGFVVTIITPQSTPYSISGHVTDGSSPLANVSISASGVPAATTDASGNYTINAAAGSYLVSAYKVGYTFTPPQSVTVPPDQAGVDFVGTWDPSTARAFLPFILRLH